MRRPSSGTSTPPPPDSAPRPAQEARGKDVEPVEILTRITELMDTGARRISSGRYLVPDTFTVRLLPADHARLVAWGLEALTAELAEGAERTVAEQGYLTNAPISVTLLADESIHPIFGAFEVEPSFTRPHSGTVLTVHTPGSPTAERYALPQSPVVIGRREGADIVIPDSAVSSRHLEVLPTPQGTAVTDLTSTNGTRLNGHRLTPGVPTLLTVGDVIMIGEGTSLVVSQLPHHAQVTRGRA